MNKLLYYIITLMHVFCGSALIAQTADNRVFVLPGDEGKEPKILSLYQNSHGYIFAGTSNGLFRFDGTDFTKFIQPEGSNTAITAICEISNTHLWLGFENGALGVMKNNRVYLLKFEEGYPKVPIKKIITDDKGVIWFATAGEGIYYYRNNKMYNINTDDGLSDNYVYDIVSNGVAGVIAATDRGLNAVLLKGEKKFVHTFSSKDGLPDNIVRCLYTSAQPAIWFGMQDGGIGSCMTDFQMLDHTKDWNRGQVNDIVSTTSQVFVATEENGIFIYDHDSNNKIISYAGNNSYLKKISCLLRDREGNTWAGGDNKLLLTAGSNIELLYPFAKRDAEKIHCLLYAKNKCIWFNTRKGVKKIFRDNNGWHDVEFNLPGTDNIDISALYEDINGLIWIGTMGKGIVILDPQTGLQKKLFKDSLFVNSNIVSITGKQDNVWIASLEGTARANIAQEGISFEYYTANKSIGNKYIYHILPDSKNRVWFASDGNGMAMLENGKFTSFDHNVEKSGSVVYRIVEDPSGNIWYSTYNSGLVKFDGKKFYKYTQDQGLSDLNITGIAVSKDNIAAFHRNRIDLINTKSGIISYIDEEQGIFNINTDLNAYTTDAEGNIYFVADTTLCKYFATYNAAQQPKTMIDHVQLFLEDISKDHNHRFRYYENNISFYYTGLFYSAPGRIEYEYKLDGYDEDWIVTKDKVKNFPQLAPGSYTFRVRASIYNNFAGAQEATFAFTILKPFWQTAWFIISCILITAAIIYFVIKAREKSIDRLNRLERETIRSQLETLKSQINPHFLFNSFNTLISEIEDNPANAITYVEKLSDFYRSIVSYREKDLIILQEEINLLNDYAYIQQKRFGHALQIQNRIENDQALQNYIAPLVLQLLIENAIKHNVVSSLNPLLVELFIDDEQYLVVRNNITPKLQQEKGSGLGLENISKRYELMTNKKVIITNDGKYFIVKIPMIKPAL